MSEGHSAAMDVDNVILQTQDFHIGQGNDAEGFIDLKRINVPLRDACVLQCLRDCKRRCSGEFVGGFCSISPP